MTKIIADSCCDTNTAIAEKLSLTKIPFTITLGEKAVVDDATLDPEQFILDIGDYRGKAGSAAPSPYLFQQALSLNQPNYVLTISSRLSCSYNNAMLGKSLSEEEDGIETHVIDTKSASAGELLAALKLNDLILECKNDSKEIIRSMQAFIDGMKTYFVLDHFDNLQKNGRLSKLKNIVLSVLHFKLIMGSDGDGNIAYYDKAQGSNDMIDKLLHLIEESAKSFTSQRMVVAHCNNPELSERLVSRIQERFHFKDVVVVPTGGLSSLYADNKGVILAF